MGASAQTQSLANEMAAAAAAAAAMTSRSGVVIHMASGGDPHRGAAA